MLNRIDSISSYSENIAVNTSVGRWSKGKNDTGMTAFDNYYIRDGHVCLRYYPTFWGTSRLYLNYSLPNLIQGNNTFETQLQDAHVAVDKLWHVLNRHVPYLGLTHADICQMNTSRLDLFLMVQVPIGTKQEYLNTYARLYLGNHHQYSHKTSTYLMSGKYTYKRRHSQSSVVRIYDKPKQLAYKQGLIDADTEDDFNWLMSSYDIDCESPTSTVSDYIRIEFQMKRPKLRRLFNNAADITFLDVLDYNFQIGCINRYIERVNLNLPILTNAHFNQAVRRIFRKHSTQQRAIHLARSIHDGYKPKFQPKDRYIIGKLKKNNIHIVTSDTFDLPPIPFLT